MRISDWSSDVCSSDLTALSEILVAGAALTHLLGVHPEAEFQRPSCQIRLLCPSQVGPGVLAIEVNHTTGMQRIGLSTGGNREILQHAALTAIDGGMQGVAVAETHRKSVVEGKRVSVRVVKGVRRVIKKTQ